MTSRLILIALSLAALPLQAVPVPAIQINFTQAGYPEGAYASGGILVIDGNGDGIGGWPGNLADSFLMGGVTLIGHPKYQLSVSLMVGSGNINVPSMNAWGDTFPFYTAWYGGGSATSGSGTFEIGQGPERVTLMSSSPFSITYEHVVLGVATTVPDSNATALLLIPALALLWLSKRQWGDRGA